MTREPDDVDAVRSVVTRVAHYIDCKDWDSLRALFADNLETDYTSLFGGTPQQQTGDALIAGWRQLLSNVATQHLLGPVAVVNAGARVEARCHVRAFHYVKGAPSGELWELLGHYRFQLAQRFQEPQGVQPSQTGSQWEIVRMQLDAISQTGNDKLLAEAAALPQG